MAESVAQMIARLSKEQAPAAPKKSSINWSALKTTKKAAPAAPKQSALGWLTDIISRPLYGVTNTINDAVNEGVKIQKGQEDPFHGALNVAHIAQGNSFAQGLSKDTTAHKTTAALEQSVADTLHKNYGTSNKINPVVKGITGFVGDIALDPLTYVPGPDIIKGFKVAKDAAVLAKNGGKAAEVASVVGKAVKSSAKEAGATLVGKGTKAAELNAETLAADAARRAPAVVDNTAVPVAQAVPEAAAVVPKATELIAKKITEAPAVTPKAVVTDAQKVGTEVAQKATNVAPTKAPQSVSDYIKGLTPNEAETTAKVVKDPSVAAPLDKESWASEVSASGRSGQILPADATDKLSTVLNAGSVPERNAALKTLKSDPSMKRFLSASVPVGGKKQPIADVIEGIAGRTLTGGTNSPLHRPAVEALTKTISAAQARDAGGLDTAYEQYLAKHAAATAAGKVITADGTELAKAAPEQATQTIARQIDNFKAAAAVHEDSMRKFLGDKTFKALSVLVNPDKFDQTLTNLDSIVAGTFDRSLLGKANVATRSFAVEKNYLKPQIVDSPEAARTADDVVAQVDPADPPKQKQAVQATAAAEHAGLDAANTTDVKWVVAQFWEHAGPAVEASREAGTQPQFTLWRAMRNAIERDYKRTVSGNTPGGRALGVETSEQQYQHFLSMFTPARQTIERGGAPFSMGEGADKIYLGHDELLQTLHDVDPAIANLQFNPTGAVAPTNLQEMAVAAARGETDLNTLTALALKSVKSGGKEANPLLTSRVLRLGGKTWANKVALAEDYARAFVKAGPDLQAKHAANVAELEARASNESSQMTANMVATLKDTMDQGTSEQTVRALNGFADGLKDEQKTIQSLDLSRELAQETVGGAVPDLTAATAKHLEASATEQVKVANKIRTVTSGVDDMSKAAAKGQSKKFDAEIDAVEKQSVPTLDLSSNYDKRTAVGMWGKAPIVGGFIANSAHDLGAADLGFFSSSAQQLSRQVLQNVATRMTKLLKSFSEDDIKLANKYVINGTVPTDPNLAQAAQAIKYDMDLLHGSESSPLNTSWWRNGTNAHHLNDALSLYGGKYRFDMGRAAADAKKSGTNIMEAMTSQWRELAKDDPTDYIMTMNAAIRKTNMEQTLVQSFHRLAKEKGLVSTVPQSGMVKVVNQSGKSIFAKYLPEDAFYDKGLAEQLHSIDSMMRESTQFSGELGQFLRGTVDPIMNLWKTGMTIIRPGHHVRNNIGDAVQTYLALGTYSPAHFKNAVKILAAHTSYTDVDLQKALMSGGRAEVPQTGDVIIKGKLKGGRQVSFTNDGLYHSAMDNGLLPNYHASENLDDASATGNRFLKALTENKVTHVVGGIAEYSSHAQNLNHFSAYLTKNLSKFATEDEALEAAARDVRKWHLGSTILTPFEKKYMRRLIPFYSWTRMAIPLVAETMLTHPQRINVFNKAQYAAATAAGVNPYSLSHPFPQDQLFPSWMTDEENGPVAKIAGNYYSIAPGISSQDVLRTFVGESPKNSLGSMLTPLIKDPIELATGTSLTTGAPIKPGEYIDNQIPGVNWVDSLAGVSPTNSLVNGKVTQTAAVAAGNKDVSNPAGVINWLTGLGVTNQSQPNYIKEAQYEQAGKN